MGTKASFGLPLEKTVFIALLRFYKCESGKNRAKQDKPVNSQTVFKTKLVN